MLELLGFDEGIDGLINRASLNESVYASTCLPYALPDRTGATNSTLYDLCWGSEARRLGLKGSLEDRTAALQIEPSFAAGAFAQQQPWGPRSCDAIMDHAASMSAQKACDLPE